MNQRNNPFSDSGSQRGKQQVPKPYNTKLYDYLQQGNSVNFIQAKELGITQLDTHIREIQKVTNVYSRTIRINTVRCMEYSLHPF